MSQKDFAKPVLDFVNPVQTVVHPDQTIEEALMTVREKDIHEKIVYFYAVDDEGKLVGIVPTRRLLLRSPKTLVKEVMDTKVICLLCTQSLKEALTVFETHHFLALPVVDKEQHFLGVIDVQLYLEESVDVVNSRRRSDIFQIIGFNLEEGKRVTTWRSYRTRMPWIFCNMFGGLACAIISKFFELILTKVIILAMFIPLVLSLSESISMQSMTLSLQQLQNNGARLGYLIRRSLREWKTIVLLALTCGAVVGSISIFWGDGIAPALTIALGIFLSICITGTIASIVPLVLHVREWDPKVAAGPIVLTCADVITTAIYLSLATWFLLSI
ncbi:MAG: CBS domain-containing protein [Candidatus Algichlamydia australiensis]|nr:CBS domain-containing protein [Chlamydiales bacterium]